MMMQKILCAVTGIAWAGSLFGAGGLPIRFGEPETLAVPLREISVQHCVVGEEEGEPVVYFTVAGSPALFHAVALGDYRLKGAYPLPDASRAWSHTIGADGSVYIGGVGSEGGSAHLYRYDPKEATVEDLGVPIAGVKFIWALTTGEDGSIYGGAWEGSYVFRYDPETDDFRDYGLLDPAEDRVRTVAWHDGYVYAGTGTINGRVWKLDPQTGERERIEIPRRPEYEEYFDQMTTVYHVQVVGDVLFLFFSLKERYMLAYDLKKKTWWDEIYADVSGGLMGEPSPDGKTFYVFTRHGVTAIDMESHEARLVKGSGGNFRGAAWISHPDLEVDNPVLVTANYNGSIGFIDPESRWRKSWPSLAKTQANPIQALEAGPDGNLYVSGYMGTIAARVNPETGDSHTFPMGQAEGMGVLGDRIYWGLYPHARVSVVDTAGDGRPAHVFDIGQDQDRPFVVTSGDEKLFVGTIPGYGRLGGALTVFDPAATGEDRLRVYPGIIPDQSIVGLAYRDGRLYGSTSIHGGLGSSPAGVKAQVFIWDLERAEITLVRELTIEGSGVHGMISGISVGPDGLIWGGVNGTVFALDPETLDVVRHRVIYPEIQNHGRWRPLQFRWGEDGLLYCNPGDKITVVDPETLEFVSAGVSSGLMTLGPEGDLYYVKGPELIRLPVVRSKDGPAPDPRFTDHGVPAPVSRARAFYAMNDEKGRRFVLIWLRDVERNAVLLVDAEDGTAEEVELPMQWSDSPYATFLHKERILYAVTGGRFWGFDVRAREWVVNEKVGDVEAMAFTQDAAGMIYAATYPGGHLMAVDPASGAVTDFGAINHEEWPQYPRALAVDREGWLYSGIGNVESQVAAYHPPTGEIRALASGEGRQRGRGHAFLATDGEVYGRLRPGGPWYRFLGGEAFPVDQPGGEPVRFRSGTQEDAFPDFPDGGRVTSFSVADRWFEVSGAEGESPRRVEFDYESVGALVYVLAGGGDGKLYGATGHPLRLFRFDPATNDSESWGFDGSNGHINAFAVDGNFIFGGIYVGGILVRYDVDKPIEHTRNGANPRVLARAGDTVMRPSSLAIHPNGKDIVMAGGGGYGATGGGMLIYDREVEKARVLTHDQLVPLHSTYGFVFGQDGTLIGGTTVAAGTGGVSRATEAVLYVMDWPSKKVVFQTVPVPGERAVLDLVTGQDGLIYGLTSGGFLFVFDPEKRKVLSVSDATEYGPTTGGQAPRVLHLDDAGNLYALFRECIVGVYPLSDDGELRHQKLADSPVPITTSSVIHDGRLFFPSHSRLWSFDLSGFQP